MKKEKPYTEFYVSVEIKEEEKDTQRDQAGTDVQQVRLIKDGD